MKLEGSSSAKELVKYLNIQLTNLSLRKPSQLTFLVYPTDFPKYQIDKSQMPYLGRKEVTSSNSAFKQYFIKVTVKRDSNFIIIAQMSGGRTRASFQMFGNFI